MSDPIFTLTPPQRRHLLNILARVDPFGTMEGRAFLLRDLPPMLVSTIPRAASKILDLDAIVEAALNWGPLLDGTPAVLTILDNACFLAADSQPGLELTALRQELTISSQAIAPPLVNQVGDFVGRADEIAELEVVMRKAATGLGVGAAIRGMGGIGKTQLALAVAARLRDIFPGAPLLIELRGAGESPLPPEQALQTVIRTFTPQIQLPAELPALRAIYLKTLADKRVLILADDAADAAQAESLLPPPGCVLLVTSRRHFTLPGLVPLDISTLPPAEAERLLQVICPRIREDARHLAHLCGYLPLALRLSASLIANTPTLTLRRYLQQLEKERLAVLRDPERDPNNPQTNVEASLRLSWDRLDAAMQSVLGQLAVFPASFDHVAAVAVVKPLDSATALDDILGTLARRSLLSYDEPAARYSLHDLVRAFAQARLADQEAYKRLVNFFVDYAERHVLDHPMLAGEALNIEIALQKAHELGLHPTLVRGTNAFYHFLEARGWYKLAEKELEWAAAAAEAEGDSVSRAMVLCNQGWLAQQRGNFIEAEHLYQEGLDLARASNNPEHVSDLLQYLGGVASQRGHYKQAQDWLQEGLNLARAYADAPWASERISGLLGNLGTVAGMSGDPQQAVQYYLQSLALAHTIGNNERTCAVLIGLGRASLDQYEYEVAEAYYHDGLELARELEDRERIIMAL